MNRTDDNPDPDEIHLENAAKALEYDRLISSGTFLRFPWPDVDALAGPLCPGWLVLIGARAKGGKSTFLREVFNAWVELGKRVVFVGTEQDAGILRLLWGCLRLQVPVSVAFDVHDPRHQRVLEDVVRGQRSLAHQGMVVANPGLTVADFTKWVRWAYRQGAQAVILDHFHRLEGASWEEQGEAIRTIKNLAAKSGLVLLVAAQLRQGEGGPLGEYEVPGPQSWAGTSNLQRECDMALQGWRPFRAGVTAKEKRLARDNPNMLANLLQGHTMAVRMSAHRYRELDTRAARLYVNEDRLESWSSRERDR